MDLNTIETVLHPSTRAGLPAFAAGDAYLGGGTWLFSEPQVRLRRLIDLPSLGWPPLRVAADGLHISATCTLAELEAAGWPSAWRAAPLIRSCCRALLGSFKIWNAATVGGNICLALPAAPMISLCAALDGICTIWDQAGGERQAPIVDIVTGAQTTTLAPGEILREIVLADAALRRQAAFRQLSLTPHGRSAALLIGTRASNDLWLTITAAVPRPLVLHFPTMPPPSDLAARIDAAVTAWHDDVHGAPDWRRQITHVAAREILAELTAPGDGAR